MVGDVLEARRQHLQHEARDELGARPLDDPLSGVTPRAYRESEPGCRETDDLLVGNCQPVGMAAQIFRYANALRIALPPDPSRK